jgi:L-alanine-DL-glutamate epimerase-like enolase superfamily enzyme
MATKARKASRPISTHLAPALIGMAADNINAAMLKLDKLAKGNTFAKSGIESALLDAQGKRLGLPVSELLGGRVRDSLEVAWTLASGDTARDIAEAEHMLEIRRHRIFKLKIGANPWSRTSSTWWRSSASWATAPACASTSTSTGTSPRPSAPARCWATTAST